MKLAGIILYFAYCQQIMKIIRYADNEFIYSIYFWKCWLTLFVAGAGGSEGSGPVAVGRNQPDEDWETGAAETSWSWGKHHANMAFCVKFIILFLTDAE